VVLASAGHTVRNVKNDPVKKKSSEKKDGPDEEDAGEPE
jgi:hypothetical protein